MKCVCDSDICFVEIIIVTTVPRLVRVVCKMDATSMVSVMSTVSMVRLLWVSVVSFICLMSVMSMGVEYGSGLYG